MGGSVLQQMRAGKYAKLDTFKDGLRGSSSGCGADFPGVEERIGVGDDFPSSEFMEITLEALNKK